MDLCPSPQELLARARSDLRMGLPVVLDSGPELVAMYYRSDRMAARHPPHVCMFAHRHGPKRKEIDARESAAP